MSRVWKIVRHGAPDQWEDSIPEESLAEGRLVVLLSRLAASHLPSVATAPLPRNAPRYTTSLTVKHDRQGNKRFVVYASGSRVHYIATLEETSPMPTGPKGEKRPADVNARAVMIAKIATGEIEDAIPANRREERARKGGLKGGKARAQLLSSQERQEIARKAAASRWALRSEEKVIASAKGKKEHQ